MQIESLRTKSYRSWRIDDKTSATARARRDESQGAGRVDARGQQGVSPSPKG